MSSPNRRPYRVPAIVLSSVVLLAALSGCSGSSDEPGVDPLEAQVAAAETAKASLDAKRAELAELVATDEGDEAQRDTLADAITAEAEAFGQQIVDVINSAGLVAGEPLSELQQRAVRLKSAEEIYVARQYIDNIGNYERAIAIYEDALALDPDNVELQQALAQANANRFITRERFDQAHNGMTDQHILELLGPPRPNNIKEWTRNGRQILAWLYPREDGAAAGVWFEKKDGIYQVYELKFEQTQAEN